MIHIYTSACGTPSLYLKPEAALGGKWIVITTGTKDIVGQWKKHFEDLLNPVTMSTVEKDRDDLEKCARCG
ncbi:hypothetical protein AMECASPLE_008303 [Ameca splendens]|uniref:Uncharacterized protein n=1 Tax=Ameca splendens TaxID=208324 RepID=A0ABV0YXU2_9TELE